MAKKPRKRPNDPIQLAKLVGDLATQRPKKPAKNKVQTVSKTETLIL